MESLPLLLPTPNLSRLLVLPHGISQSSYFPYDPSIALRLPRAANIAHLSLI